MNDRACYLTKKNCVPCEGWMSPLTADKYNVLLVETPEWKLSDGKQISRNFKFKNFKEALLFVNKVGEIAETEGHHPDISLYNWNMVQLALTTHAIQGLSENDFILAAKIDISHFE